MGTASARRRPDSRAVLLLVLVAVFEPPHHAVRAQPTQSGLPARRTEIAVPGCDVYLGSWQNVGADKQRAYPYDGKCPYIDQRQTCPGKDGGYLDWEWRPEGCALPFFDADRFLTLLQNRVLAFIGDSLGRNQFESLSCLLASAGGEMRQTGADNELHIKRHYPKYNATIELILSPYLVEHSPRTYSRNMGHKQVYLDIPDPDWHARHKDFDVILFTASGRWFLGSAKFAMKYTQKKYNQETGSKVQIMFHPRRHPWYAIKRAFKSVRKSLKSRGVFLWKTYSPSHYAGGTWDQGGHCHTNTYPSPQTDDIDPNTESLSMVMQHLAAPGLSLFNVTHMAQQRNDAHPGDLNNIAQKGSSAQDCVHWCLPGIPDVWNRFLLVHLERTLTQERPEL